MIFVSIIGSLYWSSHSNRATSTAMYYTKDDFISDGSLDYLGINQGEHVSVRVYLQVRQPLTNKMNFLCSCSSCRNFLLTLFMTIRCLLALKLANLAHLTTLTKWDKFMQSTILFVCQWIQVLWKYLFWGASLQKTAFSLVKSSLALGSTGWVFWCLFVTMPKMAQ